MNNKEKIEEIISPIKENLEVFENKLKNIIFSEDNFLKEDLSDFIFKNPKRLRPIFVYLFASILKIEEKVLIDNIALSCEIIHNASLLHDDIIDEEELRRDNPTFYSKFGSKIALLEGDLLLSIALQILSCTNLKILKIFSDRIKSTILGEIEQSSNKNKVVDINCYLKKTVAKTGNLFFAGLESLFSINEKLDNNLKKDLFDFLYKYTLAFQIKNDIDNLLNKNASDIKNGNYTLPVIYFCMDDSIDKLSEFEKENFDKYIKKSLNKVDEYRIDAIKSISNLEENAYKKSLIALAEYTLRS